MNGMTVTAALMGQNHIATRQMVIGRSVQASRRGNRDLGSQFMVAILALSMVCKSIKVQVQSQLTGKHSQNDKLKKFQG